MDWQVAGGAGKALYVACIGPCIDAGGGYTGGFRGGGVVGVGGHGRTKPKQVIDPGDVPAPSAW